MLDFGTEPEEGAETQDATAVEKSLIEIESLLANDKLISPFPDYIERTFLKESSEARTKFFIKLSILGFCAYNSFMVLDYFIGSDMFGAALVIQFGIANPLLCGIIYCVIRKFIGVEVGVLLGLFIVFGTIMFLYTSSNSKYSSYIIFTVPLCLTFGNVILALPFKMSVSLTVFCVASSTVAVFSRADVDAAFGAISLLINVNAGVYTIVGAYRKDFGDRRYYLYKLRETLRADVLSNKLEQQRVVLKSILRTSPDAMLIFDKLGIISDSNPSAELLFGWEASSLLNRNMNTLMLREACAKHKIRTDKHFSHGQQEMFTKSNEGIGLRKDGSVFPMMLHLGDFFIGDQKYFTAVIHDLSAIREVHDRSQDLRMQLAHVWSMNSLGEMAAILAHELNQPLSAISNYMRGIRTILTESPCSDHDLLTALDQAAAQALRAGEIIRRMRSLIARTDSDHRSESLRSMIMEIDFMTRLVARERDIAVRYNFAPETDNVLADRIQIQQVVSNLVRNAAEAVEGSSNGRIEISTWSVGDNWFVSVDDNGPGIGSDMAEKLFLPLTTSKSDGMGLGLTISRAIIAHHKGEIWATVSKFGGASFRFLIPRHVQ